MQHPWLVLALSFWAGTLLGAAGPLAGAALLGAALLARSRWLAVALVAVGAGSLAAAAEVAWEAAAPAQAPAAPFAGTVEDVHLAGDRIRVTVAPDPAPRWRVEVWQDARPPGLAPGARVLIHALPKPPRPPDNPGQLDAEAHAARRHVRWRARGPVRLLAPAPAPAEALVGVREAARARLDASSRPEGAAVLRGLLLGDRASVPAYARAALEASGTAHLMAVSGLHVGGLALAVGGVASWLARRLAASRPHRWAAAVALPLSLSFVALAQFPVSACRAGLMVGLFLVGRLIDRPSAGPNLLGFAALAVLATRPGAAAEPGFQLSFGAVAALLTWGGRWSGLRGALVVAVVAALATAPVQAWHFGTFAPLAPAANLVLTPFAALALVPAGALALVLAAVTPLPLDWVAAGTELLVAGAEGFAELGGGAWVVGAHLAPALAAPLAVLLHRRFGVLGAAGLIGWTLWLRPPDAVVDFVAVGQGDAVLLRGGGRAALVDTGPAPEARALLAYLRHEGVDRLDFVLLSHNHPDHDGGLAAVLAAVPVGEVLYNGRPTPPRWAPVWRRSQPRAVTSEQRTLGPLRLTIDALAPPASAAENDASLVVRVEGPGGSILLTGDLEAAGEARLVAAGVAPVSVLKAPHHGSRTSSGDPLLDSARPGAVVFTVGHENRYDFPHGDVAARYAARGATDWRTDRDGRVRVVLGEAPRISAFRRAAEPLPRAAAP